MRAPTSAVHASAAAARARSSSRLSSDTFRAARTVECMSLTCKRNQKHRGSHAAMERSRSSRRLLAGFADGIPAFAHPGCPLSCTAFWSHHQGPLKAAAASTAVASPSCRARRRRRRRRRRRSTRLTVNEPFETTFGLLIKNLRGVLLQGIAEDFYDFFRADPLFLGYPLFFGVVSYTFDTSVAYNEALHSNNGNELVRYVRGASLGCDMCIGTSVASPWH
jgi:hypothetical protein